MTDQSNIIAFPVRPLPPRGRHQAMLDLFEGRNRSAIELDRIQAKEYEAELQRLRERT
jgi:hypothetical protein